MKENKIRGLLEAGRPTTSTRIWSTWPFYTEVIGTTGNFDYVEYLAECSPYTEYDLENLVRAAELHNMGSMIKVDFQNRGYVAQKAVAAGFQAVLFADHHTPDEVRETVRIMKPDQGSEGRYGYPNRRFIGMQSHIPQQEHAKRIDDIVLCFMIEKQDAVDHIEEICGIPGVDMVQFGTSDFSLSCGKNRDQYMEECRAAERKMIEAAHRNGVAARCEIPTPDAAEYYIGLGVHHFSLGDQLAKLKELWIGDGKRMRTIANAIG